MKHLLIFISLLLSVSQFCFSQEHNIHRVSYIFNPYADSKKEIDAAIKKAGREHKHIFLIIGGDWSFWSRQLSVTLDKKEEIKKYMDEKYVIVRVNFSPLNKNSDILHTYDCPGDQGYPVIIVLDEHGRKLYTKETDEYKINNKWYKGYDTGAMLDLIKRMAEDTGKER